MKKYTTQGFTLAEVLITLVIIGVVATITMQNIFVSAHNNHYYSRFMKEYSALQTALKYSVNDYGPADSWDLTLDNGEFGRQYFSSYFRVAFDCGNNRYDKRCKTDKQLKSISGNNENFIISSKSLLFTLDDGSSWLINPQNNENYPAEVYIDVNGANKGPFVEGRDVFRFPIYKDGTINLSLATCTPGVTPCQKITLSDTKKYCRMHGGIPCIYLLLLEKKMDY